MTRLETQVLDLLREDCRLPLEKLAVNQSCRFCKGQEDGKTCSF